MSFALIEEIDNQKNRTELVLYYLTVEKSTMFTSIGFDSDPYSAKLELNTVLTTNGEICNSKMRYILLNAWYTFFLKQRVATIFYLAYCES